MGSIQLNENKSTKLLVDIIEEKAKWLAGHTFMRYPTENWETEGYKTLTWGQYANAIDKTAYWIDEQLGISTNNDTVAYLGPNDPRYSIMLPAMVKTNRNLFVPDGRVTQEGLQSLHKSTHCTAWIHAGYDAAEIAKGIGPDVKRFTAPPLEWFLNSEGYKKYPYTKTFEETKDDVILVIHTSGTTGMPKPILHTNGFHSCSNHIHTLSRHHWPRGISYDAWAGKANLSPCPPQWLAGIHTAILGPVFGDTSSIIPPPNVSGLPPDIFQKILQMNVVDGMTCPPHTVVQLYKDPQTQPLLKALKFIVYLGANLDKQIGDDLCQHLRLTSIIGSTETGPQADLLPLDRKLWHTHDYVPENGHKMERIPGSGSAGDGSDDLYELVFERAEGEENMFQCAFWNPMWKDAPRIETKELYSPVKDLDGRTRWVMSARKDDLTKLNWLAKFHAGDIETRIEQHPDVAKVFVGGEGRPRPYVIIEPREGALDNKSADELLDELYSGVIARSSQKSIAEIMIPKETVIIASKPFKLSAKQTVLRNHVEADYAEEIEGAYKRLKKENSV